jgi:hypothetical protein
MEAKPLAAFNLKPQAACKACINIYQAAYRDRVRERRNEEAKVRYHAQKDKILAYSAQYRNKHRERLNAKQRDYAKREDCAMADKLLRAKYSGELVDSYVRRSLVRSMGLRNVVIPPELMETKRIQLQIHRVLRQVNQEPQGTSI